MFGIKEITQYCEELSAKVNDTFDVPVYLNGRLTKTLGRAHSETVGNGIWMPTRLEFSKRFLETSTDECVKSVIEHEWAHYYTVKRTGESHGHDAEFKATCRMIGCTNDGTKTHVDRTVAEEFLHKYTVYCPHCDKAIEFYDRMCPTLKRIKDCICIECGCDDLFYTQNW